MALWIWVAIILIILLVYFIIKRRNSEDDSFVGRFIRNTVGCGKRQR